MGIVETSGRLWGDHIIVQGLVNSLGLKPAGQVEHEVAAMDLPRDVNQLY